MPRGRDQPEWNAAVERHRPHWRGLEEPKRGVGIRMDGQDRVVTIIGRCVCFPGLLGNWNSTFPLFLWCVISNLWETGNDAGGEMSPPPPPPPPRVVICVGDVHGYISKLESLWANLQSVLPPDAFATALVVFLGDYCDRGPSTREVIDFLLALPSRHPAQRHAFLCGNHDLAFAAFVGALPPPPDGTPFSSTWGEYIQNEENEGWYRGPGHEGMHCQGRRWGGIMKEKRNPKRGSSYMGSIYDARPTFESYGVAHGSPGQCSGVPHKIYSSVFMLCNGT